jgi:hypothetical protein
VGGILIPAFPLAETGNSKRGGKCNHATTGLEAGFEYSNVVRQSLMQYTKYDELKQRVTIDTMNVCPSRPEVDPVSE